MPGAPPVGGTGNAGVNERAHQANLNAGGEYTATTREVQDNELVGHQLSELLDSDSRYINQARASGLAQANARGGLGGTMGVQAAVQAAIRNGLPIAQADAQAYRDAAAQNMNALNQFGLANMQRVAQLEMANLDANTKVQVQGMANASQQAIAKLQAMTQLQNTALQGEIQARLADQQYLINQVLNWEQHGYRMEQLGLEGEYRLMDTELRGEYNLAQTDLQGQYNLAGVDRQGEWNYHTARETNYTNQAVNNLNAYYQRLDNLNGIEMDDAARRRAEEQYYNDYVSQMNLLNSLYPDIAPISMAPPPGGEGG
jgi:VCBS repeat-containing protein